MPPPPRPSIAPSKPVMPAALPNGSNPTFEKRSRPGDVRKPLAADVRHRQVEPEEFAARRERRDALTQRPGGKAPASAARFSILR